jgi:hypothetical protein
MNRPPAANVLVTRLRQARTSGAAMLTVRTTSGSRSPPLPERAARVAPEDHGTHTTP